MTKLSPAEAADVQQRNLVVVAVLSTVTLGFYSLYLCYQWAKEINGLEGRVKYNPVVVLLVSVVTLCIGILVYECLFAHDAANAARERGLESDRGELPTWVVLANALGVVASLIPFGVLVGVPLGIAATVLVQAQFNRLAAAPVGEVMKP
jgi:hypothetical protein